MAIRTEDIAGLDFSDVAGAERIGPVTPGEVLREEFMLPLGLSGRALARELGVPSNRITEIVAGERAVWSSRPVGDTFDCVVQLRAHGMTSPATVTVEDGTVRAQLHAPQRGVAAGQALVMYDGDLVLGSATITSAA